MSDTVIKIEGVSKQYRLGTVGTGTLGHDVNRLWAKLRGKEDPLLKIGEANDRTQKGNSNYVWALQDINFEVKKGEVLGIIGRNGAGKSTLLKILSRTTTPTTGNIKIKGRVASLLEVGTGFHPELSGRENIYLNGGILGMMRREIKSKFDEIVDFAGVERYIDTPVKRYSSGMYVRLAFAVAAHLEPEILIVDEVLAVGDLEFQRKCLGKMKDVSGNNGRTVLFVSHNIDAVLALCTRGVLLDKGLLHSHGKIDGIVENYLAKPDTNSAFVDFEIAKLERSGEKIFGRFLSIEILSSQNQTNRLTFHCGFKIRLQLRISERCPDPEIGIAVSNSRGQRFHHLVSSWHVDWHDWEPGIRSVVIEVPEINLYPGKYNLSTWFRPHTNGGSDDFIENAAVIEIVQNGENADKQFVDFSQNGGVYLRANWTVNLQ